MLKIVSAPDNALSEPAKPVVKIDKSVLNLIAEMKQALNATHDPEGVGLAAPQVGKSLQIFITKPARKSRIQVFINPEIREQKTENRLQKDRYDRNRQNQSSVPSVSSAIRPPSSVHRPQKSIKLEGCLSLPNIWGEVERSNEVEVSYMDEKGKEYTRLFKGFLATIIQHEFDHLQGNLFPKRVLEQKGKLYKSHKNNKGEDEFEEIEI